MLGLDDLHYEDSMFAKQEEAEEDYEPEVEEEEAEEVDDPMETQSSVKTQSRSRTHNYCQEEDIALCHAWMNVSLDASVGTDQSKEKFWGRIEEYYNTIMEVPSSRTQGSLGHRWGNILEQCNRWSSCIDQVNHAPPSGVQISAYGPIHCTIATKNLPTMRSGLGRTPRPHRRGQGLAYPLKPMTRRMKIPTRGRMVTKLQKRGKREEPSAAPTRKSLWL